MKRCSRNRRRHTWGRWSVVMVKRPLYTHEWSDAPDKVLEVERQRRSCCHCGLTQQREVS